ncbi:GNAT family N-acetyltransferase [Bacillus sp. sid0103]|nr:GNAT family N-acetyltransferase [Bacillus sp. sid0103]
MLTDVAGIASVHVDSWRTTYANIVPNEYINDLTYEKRAGLWEQIIPNGQVFVAEDDNGHIVGFANGGPERTGEYPKYAGEMYAIYILQDFQKQGLGEQLIKAVVADLLNQNIHSMLVWVFQDNTSRYFYEKMGGKVVDRETVDFVGTNLIELAYGWEDINLLK